MSGSDRSKRIVTYNAFTDRPFDGNPAGVVLEGGDLDPEVMQRIAAQMNLSETAFLTPATRPEADVRLRWFTPTMEVELCGHATIATFTAAAEHGLYPPPPDGDRTLKVETISGVLRIRIADRGGRPQVRMQLPVPRFEPLELDATRFADAWNTSEEDLDGGPWLRTDLHYWYVPVRDLERLRRLRLDIDRLREFDERAGFTFYTVAETVESDSDWHLRFFAPFHGVPEDPVTGSAQGPMGALYSEYIREEMADGEFAYRGEQGDALGRPGRVGVYVRRGDGRIEDLEIAGSAIPMLEGTITY